VSQETRSFNADTGTTRTMRSKEEAHDYRYFPDPDLPPLVLTPERIDGLRAELPELPWQRRARFAERYGVTADAAQVLTTTRELADYYEAAVSSLPSNPKGIANWVMGEVLRELKERRVEVDQAIDQGMAPTRLAALVALVDAGRISTSAATQSWS